MSSVDRGADVRRTRSLLRQAPVVEIAAHAVEPLHLDRLDVVHAGSQTFPLEDRIRAVAAVDISAVLGGR